MFKTRIALLLKYIPPYRVPFFQELTRRVDNLKIFISTTMEPNRYWSVDWQDLNVSIQRTVTIPYNWRHPGGFAERLYLHFPYDTFSQLWNYQPDVIISSELGTRSLQAALYRRLHRNCRLILWGTLSERSEQGRGILREWFRPWLIHQADAVVVNGKSGARYISRFGYPSTRIFTVSQSPPTEIFAAVPLKRPSAPPVKLLAVGQLVERKGLIPFLKVLSQWAATHPDQIVELKIVGEGPQREALIHQSVPMNLHVQLMGHFNYTNMPALYAEADIFAFPTLADEWGLVVNEAMAAGLPVLGSMYSQAVEELVLDGKTGWTFRTDQIDEVKRAIDQALSLKPEELALMRIAVRNEALKITPITMADQILEAIKFVTT